MTDMIERVARAICRAGGKDPDETMIELGGVRTPMWDAFVPIARAAIEAMREPTEAMVAAMGSDLTDEGEPRAGTQASLELSRAHWRKGIDAALNPPGEPGKD